MHISSADPATFTTLPSYLVGGEYIKAYQADAGETSSTDQEQFDITRYSYLYQLIDAANAMPVHDNNATYQWVKLADTIVIRGRTMNIYKSRLMAPRDIGFFPTTPPSVSPLTLPLHI